MDKQNELIRNGKTGKKRWFWKRIKEEFSIVSSHKSMSKRVLRDNAA